jgi:heme exporter protein A
MRRERSRRWRRSNVADDDFYFRIPFAMADDVSGVVVHAERLGKSFGRAVVLREVSLRVAAGETIALFGPNGAGKSTLLRVCATLMTPTSGSLRLFDARPPSPETRRRIGLVAHQSFLYPDLTARENLLFYAGMYALADAPRLVATWLARVDLEHAADRPVRTFSRGMEQRLALARALLHDPELVLLDEPWSGLDAAAADWLAALLGELRARGRTIVAATHDFARGLGVADRAVILYRGRVAWTGEVGADVSSMYRQITGAVAA